MGSKVELARDGDHMLGAFIPLHYHFPMLANPVRMLGFKEAIATVVPTGSTVLELGAGTGVMSFFAAQRAARVIAIERLPENVEAARTFLRNNGAGDRVTVIQADAYEFLPTSPVDVVICELLHTALLREHQAEVIARFKDRYLDRFGPPLPRFIPEAIIMAVQPLEQGFDFFGYEVPLPIFADGFSTQREGNTAKELAPPQNYAGFEYRNAYPEQFAWSGEFTIGESGVLNALRFVTKNVLAILVDENRTVDWLMQYLVLPLSKPLTVTRGQVVDIGFDYAAGAPIHALTDSFRVEIAL